MLALATSAASAGSGRPDEPGRDSPALPRPGARAGSGYADGLMCRPRLRLDYAARPACCWPGRRRGRLISGAAIFIVLRLNSALRVRHGVKMKSAPPARWSAA